MTQFALAAGSLYGLIGVLLGAFGAHALASKLSADLQAIWHTAVQYQFYHALALLAVGLLARQGMAGASMMTATVCFALGTLIFSGSLYVLAFSGIRWLGAITPIGGVLLIVGWAALLWPIVRS
ncbi:Putative membrane protein [Salinisphaera shabanensis E1L3A]|uniref:Membrane protein n=1 Tax=Salinisphaera shabanensis E1L3A TaxID=1033802 RepID=U2E752_9GAMM|nr:DUF423 domain-containing protein [Salinisphaera shabanensis]ERJ19561.1 Putative membrane protein [Salinisphaera shabanensis E1L3A]